MTKDMPDGLIEILESTGHPVFLKGTLTDTDELPESFITFWNTSTNRSHFYNNQPFCIEYTYEVAFFSTDPELTNSVLLNLQTELIENNFVIGMLGTDTYTGDVTYTGRTMTITYIWRR